MKCPFSLPQEPLYKEYIHRLKDEVKFILEEYNDRITQPTLQIIKKYRPTLQKGLDKFTDIALKTLKILSTLFISGGFLYIHSGFFLIGTTCGIIYPELMVPSIDRISKIWNKHFLLVTAFSLIAPFSFCIASLFIGANISLYFRNSTLQKS